VQFGAGGKQDIQDITTSRCFIRQIPGDEMENKTKIEDSCGKKPDGLHLSRQEMLDLGVCAVGTFFEIFELPTPTYADFQRQNLRNNPT
jgi:hypothetical protein